MTRSPHFKRNKSIPELIADQRKSIPLADSAWYKVTTSGLDIGFSNGYGFQSSWANVGGNSNPPCSWYLSESGEVRFRGKITGGSAGTIAFVLPPEVRPQYAETFIVAVDNGGQANVIIRQNGEVYIESIG